jgi:hypothetical protein
MENQFVWCLHCETVHTLEDWKKNGRFCPQPGCDGSRLDEWPWDEVRGHNPDYPRVPEIGKGYPMYGKSSS